MNTEQFDRFSAAARGMDPKQHQQAIELGEACAALLGSRHMSLAWQALQATYYNDFRTSQPEHHKAREAMYQRGRALDDIQDWLVEQAQFAHFLRQGQADQADPEAQEQDRLNRQGFGLDEDYNPTR